VTLRWALKIILWVEGEFNLGVILKRGEMLEKDGLVDRSVCEKDGEDESPWCCGRGFMKKKAYGEIRDEERIGM